MANHAGRKPHPGLALLRLSQGQADAADAAIRLALQEARGGRARVTLLRAAVDIMLAKHDVTSAREAARELARISDEIDLPFPRAVSSQAAGAVALHEGRALDALASLGAACLAWQELDAPYDLAQVMPRASPGRLLRAAPSHGSRDEAQ